MESSESDWHVVSMSWFMLLNDDRVQTWPRNHKRPSEIIRISRAVARCHHWLLLVRRVFRVALSRVFDIAKEQQ